MIEIKDNYRTWIEIDSRAARRNYEIFRKITGPKVHPHTKRGEAAGAAHGKTPRSGVGVKLWAVVKSNAYGHGLLAFSKLLDGLGVDGFCVDSIVEGLRLRKEGIRKPILVLGPTLWNRINEAAPNDITVSVSNMDSLKAVLKSPKPPSFHIKVDTGMHRQGFYLKDLPQVADILKRKENHSSKLSGIYTHFASAKDVNYPTYTDLQFGNFNKAAKVFERRGFKNLTRHCAATGAALINKKYHLDAVRLGIGLYGLWPSRELEIQLGRRIHLRPVLSWRTVVSEVKNLAPGGYVGYDLTERVARPTKMAVLPVGYWHGYPRALSSTGEVLLRGRRAKVLGRVSMDLTTVDSTGINCRPTESATLLGRDGGAELSAYEVAQRSGTTHYEFLTRLNPLIERVVV